MRPIDADELKVDYIVASTTTNTSCYQYVSKEQIDNAPTIDSVKHGKWESNEYLYTTGQTRCSSCKTEFYVDDLLNVGEGAQEYLPNYCPHCGVSMERREE